MPEISVLLPVYNGERYLDAAITSVRRQTLRDWELIIVDDGSTDSSADLARRHAAADGRIRLCSRPNTGIVGALNDALALAAAPFVARMDADDLCFPRRLEIQLAYLKNHPEIVACGTAIILIDERNTPFELRRATAGHTAIDQELLRGTGGIFHPTLMIRTDVLRAVGGYREGFRHAEDKDLWLRLCEVGELANLSQPLLRYRVHPTQITSLTDLQQEGLDSLTRAIQEACRRRSLPVPELELIANRERLPAPAEFLSARAVTAARSGFFIAACRFLSRLLASEGPSRRWWITLVLTGREIIRAPFGLRRE